MRAETRADMGLKDWFSKKKETPEVDPLHDLSLEHLKPGYFVDFDLKTWEVTGYNVYEWEEESAVNREWRLSASDDVVYLELEVDDDRYWSINRKIPFQSLGPEVGQHLRENQDPPDEIVYNGVTFYLEEMAGGYFREGEEGVRREMLRWSYEDDSGDRFLTIEQWGEDDFEASTGEPAHEYQFTNILPGNLT